MQQWFGLVVVLCNLVSAWLWLDCVDALGTDSNLAAGGIDGWSAMPASSHLLTAQAAALLPGQKSGDAGFDGLCGFWSQSGIGGG
jgi:hypothetical protein